MEKQQRRGVSRMNATVISRTAPDGTGRPLKWLQCALGLRRRICCFSGRAKRYNSREFEFVG